MSAPTWHRRPFGEGNPAQIADLLDNRRVTDSLIVVSRESAACW